MSDTNKNFATKYLPDGRYLTLNIITIDPSLACTAMCINGKHFIYATKSVAQNKSGSYKRWFDRMADHTEYRLFDGVSSKLPHSQSDIAKLRLYNDISSTMLRDIKAYTTWGESVVCIEGYSYSSATQSILDLVTLGTLIRLKIILDITPHLMVISPSTLKVRACELTYGKKFNAKGKKITSVNNNDVAGGRFKKPEMLDALLENDCLVSDWYVNILRDMSDDLKSLSKVPKPIEDLNDAKLMYEIILKITEDNYDTNRIESELLA